MSACRLLVVNADDFGFTRDVNDGILRARADGILTAATLMANGAAFEHAAELAARNSGLDVGCHFVLVGGRSVAEPSRMLPASLGALVRALAWRQFDLEAELEAQASKIRAAGLRPLHADTHKHTHLLPPVLGAVARVAARHGIRWIRRPFDLPLGVGPWRRRAAGRWLGILNARLGRVLGENGLRSPDHFLGFALTGLYRTPQLVDVLGGLPPGLTELMTHPGFCREELRQARTRLKESRERELEALTSPLVRAAVARAGIRLVRYRDLESPAAGESRGRPVRQG